MDASFGEVSLWICSTCSTHWLRYSYEVEAFTGSGRWYLGAISNHQAERLVVQNARILLEGLAWYYFGGSYYKGLVGRALGKLALYP